MLKLLRLLFDGSHFENLHTYKKLDIICVNMKRIFDVQMEFRYWHTLLKGTSDGNRSLRPYICSYHHQECNYITHEVCNS